MKATEFIKMELLIWLIILTPFVFAIVNWGHLPERIPIHWGINGYPNHYNSRGIGILVLPMLSTVLYFFLLLLPKIDPRRGNYEQFKDTYRIIRLLIHSIFTVAYVILLMYSLHTLVNVGYYIFLMMSVFFIVIGNFISKIRPNYFIGLRTPWTLSNDEVWVKTHRVTGRVMVVVSFIYLILNLFLPLPNWGYYVYLTIIIIFPFIYSYIKYREITANVEQSGRKDVHIHN
jgi:uncharacterized membrane protein